MDQMIIRETIRVKLHPDKNRNRSLHLSHSINGRRRPLLPVSSFNALSSGQGSTLFNLHPYLKKDFHMQLTNDGDSDNL